MSKGAQTLIRIKGRSNFFGTNQGVNRGEDHVNRLPANRVERDQT